MEQEKEALQQVVDGLGNEENKEETKKTNYDFVMGMNELQLATFISVQILKFLESQDLSLDTKGLETIKDTYYYWLKEKCNIEEV